MQDCYCKNWVRLGNDILFSEHNKLCTRRDIENEAKGHLFKLLEYIEHEANMGDGINDDFYEAYRNAKFFTTGKTKWSKHFAQHTQ